MQLSIIIVNYNVKHFLELCLSSLRKATQGLLAEVIVVDNASSDGSEPYIKALFPEVQYIYSATNLGFAKANNLGWQKAQGEYILFLNPDTIIAENTLHLCLAAYNAHANMGALGVRMVDGSGRFLPESKRGLPTAITSFFKITGLYRLFPTNKIIAAYYHGNLSPTQNHVIDVVAGAFMVVPKSVLLQVGGFDERYFMYAEDVDLSYSIQQLGKDNYYLADTTIIHFKGESTLRGSYKFVKIFYQAMLLFVTKHYKGVGGWLFSLLLRVGIVVSAGLSFLNKRLKQMFAFLQFGKKEAFNFSFFENIIVEGIAPNPAGKAATVYHCGKNSFKNIIADIQANDGEHFFVNANGTHLIRSGDKYERGSVQELK